MWKQYWLIALFLGICICLPGKKAHAQFPVIDAANLVESTWSNVQLLTQILQWVIDLGAIDGGTEGGGAYFGDDMHAMGDLVREARGLSWDLQALNRQLTTILSLDEAPVGSEGLSARSREMRRIIYEGHLYAMRTQTLIRTVEHTVHHVLRITDKIGKVLGGVSGHQNGQEFSAKIAQLQAQQHLTTTAFERAESVQHMDDPITVHSIERIKQNVRSDMPGTP